MSSSQDNLPYFAEGEVVAGFGRGSKELGIPTANFPENVIRSLPSSFDCGVYYGWAKLSSNPDVFKMSMCVGWNPYYHNTVKTMETHIIHTFDSDFYGDIMKIIVLGYIRPMCDFPSLDALIEAIHHDNEVASQSLDKAENLQFKHHKFFQSFQPSKTSEKGAAEIGAEINENKSASTNVSERLCENAHIVIKDRVTSTDASLTDGANTLISSKEDIFVSSKGKSEGLHHENYVASFAQEKNVQSHKLELSNGDALSSDGKNSI
ncbi:riboflavin kinase [Plakobranchus ocellatus]|uniref:Riboflavin kinase n=1 Tax=Plakobranchus ocellatus TaxID=259542 RepID=A0AAV4CWU6_9GAST|nr:riboflavin kinase [Plakobranchus ocellatus]